MALPPAELLWIKALHVLACLSSVAWGRYQVVYLNSLGIAPSGIGALRAAGLGAKFLSTPLWGAWQDAQPRSTTPALASIAATSALLGLYRSPAVVASMPRLFVLKMARSGANGLGTLVDALTLRVVERHGAGYGAQRLWTGLAWGAGSYAAGHAIDTYGYDAIWTWTYGFAALVAASLALRPAGARAAKGEAKADAGGDDARANLRAYAAFARSHPNLRCFLALMGLYGVAMSLVEALLFLQMAREFESTAATMGAVTLVGTCAELPIFARSERLLRRFGAPRLLAAAHAAMAARLLLLACVTPATAPWALPALQILHGPCFALAWTAAVRYAADAAPGPLKATSQAILSSTYYVLGAGVGSVVWSAVYEHRGATATYVLGAGLVASAGAALLPRLDDRRRLLPVADA